MSFTITIVLLKHKPIAIKTDVIMSFHKKYAKTLHITKVKITWPHHVRIDTFHTSLMILGLRPNHTKNNNKEIPIWAKSSIQSWLLTMPCNWGDKSIHHTIYHTMLGWRSNCMIYQTISKNTTTNAISATGWAERYCANVSITVQNL